MKVPAAGINPYQLVSRIDQTFGARVAKLADAPDLGSGGEILRGSSPLPGKTCGDALGHLRVDHFLVKDVHASRVTQIWTSGSSR
jgi:hypothetical protein